MKTESERFEDAVRSLARVDGVDHVLSIPGVWEVVSEYYNNDAIDLMRNDVEEDETDDEERDEIFSDDPDSDHPADEYKG